MMTSFAEYIKIKLNNILAQKTECEMKSRSDNGIYN